MFFPSFTCKFSFKMHIKCHIYLPRLGGDLARTTWKKRIQRTQSRDHSSGGHSFHFFQFVIIFLQFIYIFVLLIFYFFGNVLFLSFVWTIFFCCFLQTLFNPNKTVVKMFLVTYNFGDMPVNHMTFLRHRIFLVPVDEVEGPGEGQEGSLSDRKKILCYLIHLR